MRCPAIILFIVILSLFASPRAERVAVALNNLQAKGVEQSSADIISERLRSELVQTGVFTVLERAEMDQILKEQGFQASGACSDNSCLVQIGQILGVQYMISGQVGKLGNLFTINLRMINVASGQIEQTVNVDRQCGIEVVLSELTPEVARKMAATRKGGPAEKSATNSVGKKKHSPVRIAFQTGLGVGAAACLVAGVLYDRQAQQKSSEQKTVYQAYRNLGAGGDFTGTQAHYNSLGKEVDKDLMIRNILYVSGAALCAGIGVTLFF